MSTQIDDKVWYDAHHRFGCICSDTTRLRSESNNVLIVAHFPATLSIVESSLRAQGISFQTFSMFDSSTLCSADLSGKVLVGLARALQPPNPLAAVSPAGTQLQIIVAEHYPVYGKDKNIVEITERLLCRPPVCFHTSLDDPLLKHFGSDHIVALFERMGMEDGECVSHPLVTAAIRNAQQQIEKNVQRDLQTESIEEWFRFNLGVRGDH